MDLGIFVVAKSDEVHGRLRVATDVMIAPSGPVASCGVPVWQGVMSAHGGGTASKATALLRTPPLPISNQVNQLAVFIGQVVVRCFELINPVAQRDDKIR
jgi:hypothetical protein